MAKNRGAAVKNRIHKRRIMYIMYSLVYNKMCFGLTLHRCRYCLVDCLLKYFIKIIELICNRVWCFWFCFALQRKLDFFDVFFCLCVVLHNGWFVLDCDKYVVWLVVCAFLLTSALFFTIFWWFFAVFARFSAVFPCFCMFLCKK